MHTTRLRRLLGAACAVIATRGGDRRGGAELRPRTERLAGVRRLGEEPRRLVQHDVRLHEPQLGGRARRPGRAGQRISPGPAGPGPADAFSAAPQPLRVQGARAKGLGQQGTGLDADRERARPSRRSPRCAQTTLVDNLVQASEQGALGTGISSPAERANKPPELRVEWPGRPHGGSGCATRARHLGDRRRRAEAAVRPELAERAVLRPTRERRASVAAAAAARSRFRARRGYASRGSCTEGRTTSLSIQSRPRSGRTHAPVRTRRGPRAGCRRRFRPTARSSRERRSVARHLRAALPGV